MGCLFSQDQSEAIVLINTLTFLINEKSEALFNVSNLKISRHLTSKPLDLKLQNDSQITKEYLDSKINELNTSLTALKSVRQVPEPDFLPIFSNFDHLLQHPFYEEIKFSLKSTLARVKNLNFKVRELQYIREDLEQENLTIEDLEQRRQDSEQEIQKLRIKALDIKEKVSELKDYLESLKRRKRRFTVATLPESKSQLRSKVLIKQEMEKKIEILKLEQSRFLQRIEEKKEKMQENLDFNGANTPRHLFVPLSFNDGFQDYQEFLDVKKKLVAERRGTAVPRVNKG